MHCFDIFTELHGELLFTNLAQFMLSLTSQGCVGKYAVQDTARPNKMYQDHVGGKWTCPWTLSTPGYTALRAIVGSLFVGEATKVGATKKTQLSL